MSRQVRSHRDRRLEWRVHGSSASWNALQRLAVPEPSDSEGEDGPVVLALDVPTVILAAHHRFRLDFALLPFECVRHGCSWAALEEWIIVDSLAIVQTVVAKLGGCAKLQCLVRGHDQEGL